MKPARDQPGHLQQQQAGCLGSFGGSLRQAGTKVLVTVYGNSLLGQLERQGRRGAEQQRVLRQPHELPGEPLPRPGAGVGDLERGERLALLDDGAGPRPLRRAPARGVPAVKSADPNATVVFGGTSGNDTGFVDGAYRAGAKGSFDVIGGPSVHRLGPGGRRRPVQLPGAIARFAT